MRPLLYWLAALFFAVFAARAAERPDEGVLIADVGAPLLAVTDPARSMLLGVGILALAFTYRQAWAALRKR